MVVHQDWRYRDFVTLIAMVEHLVHAYGDAQCFDAAEELACDRRSFNSVAMELTQAQECARGCPMSFVMSRRNCHGVNCAACETPLFMSTMPLMRRFCTALPSRMRGNSRRCLNRKWKLWQRLLVWNWERCGTNYGNIVQNQHNVHFRSAMVQNRNADQS